MLYERHAAAARALARQYVSPSDAEDVVADAFSKLFEMLRRGAGPDTGFRPYLYTVVRHRAFDVRRGAVRTRPSTDDEIESVLGRVASEEDPALADFERSVVYRAYADLPERWREVLWYVLVDDVKPAQVAPLLGLSPNGVSALLYRAKEALRAGYLQQHLTHAPSDTCRTVNPLLGGYVRDSLSKRETTKITEHLATCGTCSALVLELHDVAHGMKTVIAPLVLGAGGLALVGAGAPIGGLAVAAKAGAGAGAGAAAGAPAATTATVSAAGTFSGGVTSAVTATAGAVASAAAAATGGSVAAGAIAVAAVGVVAALQMAAPVDAGPVAVADTVVTTPDESEQPGTEQVDGRPVQPTDIEPGETTSRAYLVVGYTDASTPMLPRERQELSLTVENEGDVAATGTQLEITLPEGLTVARPDVPFGTGAGARLVTASVEDPAGAEQTAEPGTTPTPGATSGTGGTGTAAGTATGTAEEPGNAQAMPDSEPTTPATVGLVETAAPAACTPTEQDNVLLCSLGEVTAGQELRVVVPVEASAGGDYPVGAVVWADGMEPTEIDLPGRTVSPFGQELSAATTDVSLASPGTAALPVRVTSTGDRAVPPGGWAVDVTLPDGVTPAAAQPELSCAAGELKNVWRCTPFAGTDAAATELAPGATADVALNIATVTPSASEYAVLGSANVRPVLDGNAHSALATLAVTSAWADAADGVGTVAASCVATGGAGVAQAAVTGTYTNTTQRTVRVALEAAGEQVASKEPLAPGESVRLTVPDGLRLPAGQAVFALATDVEGGTYTTRVAAGEHQRADCYVPKWDTDTSVRTLNQGGTVAVEGSITNRTGETMTAVMLVPVGDSTLESVRVPVAAGGSVTLTVNTDRTQLPAGEVTFRLSREGVDTDGDLPVDPVVPKTHPTASYGAARIAPAVVSSTVAAGTCEFDATQDHSVQTFVVSVSNKDSTLPVLFHVGGVSRTVAAGEAMQIEYPVVWGTSTVEVKAAGRTLDTLDTQFESCAELTWPTQDLGVTVAAECTDYRVALTAAVENRTAHDWMGVLVRESSGEVGAEAQVVAGQTTPLTLVRDTLISEGSNVSVRLTRELEGNTHTVERSFWVKGAACLNPDGSDVCEPAPEPEQSATPAATAGPSRTGRGWPWGGYCE
ncbi:sigma-70 family RNA polymerase sigma factor [Promicromonospora sp. NPDC050880]|uniref:sigma-70 family RNA polymerase sigma factor n=1 Tax=Promicromonospora sp. NPDC050880 TaxID=3364406 RepID=UPI0037A8FDA0